MGANKPTWIPLLALGLYLGGTAIAQSTGQTVRHHKVVEQDSAFPPELTQAESAIEKGDDASAEPLLKKVVATDPNNFQAWFDLGFVYNGWETFRSPLLHIVNRWLPSRTFLNPISISDSCSPRPGNPMPSNFYALRLP